MDLSSANGDSLSDFISKEEYTLYYATFDRGPSLAARNGKITLMAKLDMKNAFRLCQVRLANHILLGMFGKGI